MSVSIIFGGQYGSEGKGKAALFWAEKIEAAIAVRVGGSNSGHTIWHDSQKYVFRMLPTPCVLRGVQSILPAGTYIDVPVFFKELELSKNTADTVCVDPNAVIIQDIYKKEEAALKLQQSIGSTLSGTGAAVAARVKRGGDHPVLMAKYCEPLKPFLRDTKLLLRQQLNQGAKIVIEGTQGYGLSNIHSPHYPFATSRDTSAAGFLAETGLSPFDVEHVIMVIRTFPIRVAGNSGPLPNEIDWRIIAEESGASAYFSEKTTVTQKERRVARFDPKIVKESIRGNCPDVIIMNHVDYLDYEMRGKLEMSVRQKKFIEEIESQIGQKVDYIGNDEVQLVPRRRMME